MYVYDTEGSIVCLTGACIYVRVGREYDTYDAEAWAQLPGVNSEYSQAPSYLLHQGTLAECRDYMGQLATWLKPHSFDVPSSKREQD